MEITLQYFDGCPNWKTTAAYLSTLVDEGLAATVDYELIDTHELAITRNFHGSPTVLIDGSDPFADDLAPVGLACRIYRTDHGPAGSPSMSQLRHAITGATEE
jgi:hypothetical protein